MADEGRRSSGSTRRSSVQDATAAQRQDGTSSQSQSQSSSAHFGTASQTSDTSRTRRAAPLHAYTEGYGAINANLPPNPPASPETTRPKKPGIGRRTTSTHYPHKGEQFSVDDNEEEVAEDQERERQRPRHARLVTGTLRGQPSTLRRRPTAQQPSLARVASVSDTDAIDETDAGAPTDGVAEPTSSGEEGTLQAKESTDQGDDEDDVSDAESFTLKDRQEAINTTHPFGIRIWKPALYKKSRSVIRNAEGDIHSSPGLHVSNWLLFFNLLWTLLFGWWLALLCIACAIGVLLFAIVSECAWDYAAVLKGLAGYLFYPFGKYVKLIQDEAYAEEDEGEGRSISEYEQWQSGDIEEGRLFFGPVRSLIGRRRPSADSASETQSLLGRPGRHRRQSQSGSRPKRRLFGRGEWTLGRIVFYIAFYGLICPPLFLVSGICWLLVFSIPMGRVTLLLFDHLRRHPLAIAFHSATTETRYPGEPPSSILLCTYRAVGLKYWKYTVDGTNVFLINLLAVVAFTIFDFYVFYEALHLHIFLTNTRLIFALALFSIIPLAYFIGQAVASISAQSSMGLGATINAFFSTVVEVFLYCVALNEGKAQLVEGSIIGSIFAGVLFLPGLSMCFGALKRKTQRFNVKSAGVTSTMMLFAVIGAFGPTLFYQIYGSHELKCHQCKPEDVGHSADRDCRRCFFSQVPAVHDSFYTSAVLPYIWFSAAMLFLSYVIGLLFTLRTHAAVIWSSEPDEKKAMEPLATSQTSNHTEPVDPRALTRQSTAGSTTGILRTDIRDSQLYQRILGQSLKQVGMSQPNDVRDVVRPSGPDSQQQYPSSIKSPHIVPPRSRDGDIPGLHLQGLSEQDNTALTRQIAEMAATAAAVAARDATKAPHKAARMASSATISGRHSASPQVHRVGHSGEVIQEGGVPEITHAAGGGHDAPNWSRTKSAVILLTATVAYAVIAEILVHTVDAVLENFDIDEKFLGISLFALVPNTTEFLNAISFAMNGNIALSMEIGSAYALQVCLLQIPALVLYSALFSFTKNPSYPCESIMNHTFTLIFPQWDMVTVILCVFLLSYMYGEGKSNYFKGSILILSYLVVIVGFWFASFDAGAADGVDDGDTLALGGSPRFGALGAGKSGFVMNG